MKISIWVGNVELVIKIALVGTKSTGRSLKKRDAKKMIEMKVS